jgi:hypothetical protein
LHSCRWSAAVRFSASQPAGASAIKRQVSGSFVFTDPGSHHPITVWFCRPHSFATDTRIVFVMHGSESQTARQACDIASPDLQTLNALVLAPQFAETHYPGDSYMVGDMLDPARKIRPKDRWALTVIERLFDAVRHDLALRQSDYDIVGSLAALSSCTASCSSCRKLVFGGPWPRAQADTYFHPGLSRFPTAFPAVRLTGRIRCDGPKRSI